MLYFIFLFNYKKHTVPLKQEDFQTLQLNQAFTLLLWFLVCKDTRNDVVKIILTAIFLSINWFSKQQFEEREDHDLELQIIMIHENSNCNENGDKESKCQGMVVVSQVIFLQGKCHEICDSSL